MKKIILAFLALFLLAQHVSAYIFLNIYIEENGEAVFLGETNEFPNLPEGISLENEIITGSTQSLTKKEGDVWMFSYTLEGAEINIILPEGATLLSLSQGEISIDDNKISIFVSQGADIQYNLNSAEKESKTLLFLILTISLIIILSIIYFIKKKHSQTTKTKEPSKLEIIKQVLSDREKQILEQLKKAGKIKSSHLRKLTGIPKASFSRHIQELEKKRIIKRSGEGRNKFIEITEN